jgi:hypothetical protein
MATTPSSATRRTAWTLRGLAVLFLTFDVSIKLLQLPMA